MPKKIETTLIKNLRKEYEEKLNKAIHKEEERIQKIRQEFLDSLLDNLLNDEKFEQVFLKILDEHKGDKIKTRIFLKISKNGDKNGKTIQLL